MKRREFYKKEGRNFEKKIIKLLFKIAPNIPFAKRPKTLQNGSKPIPAPKQPSLLCLAINLWWCTCPNTHTHTHTSGQLNRKHKTNPCLHHLNSLKLIRKHTHTHSDTTSKQTETIALARGGGGGGIQTVYRKRREGGRFKNITLTQN